MEVVAFERVESEGDLLCLLIVKATLLKYLDLVLLSVKFKLDNLLTHFKCTFYEYVVCVVLLFF